MNRLSRQTAEGLCHGMMETMEALLSVVEQETGLVREGKIFAADQLKPRQSLLVNRYTEAVRRLESIGPELDRAAPKAISNLRREHETFRSILRINLAALATARELAQAQLGQLARGNGMTPRVREEVPAAPAERRPRVARRA